MKILIISLYKRNDDIVAQLTPAHNGSTYPNIIHNKKQAFSYCNMRIVIHKRYAKWKFIYHVLSCHNNIHRLY